MLSVKCNVLFETVRCLSFLSEIAFFVTYLHCYADALAKLKRELDTVLNLQGNFATVSLTLESTSHTIACNNETSNEVLDSLHILEITHRMLSD